MDVAVKVGGVLLPAVGGGGVVHMVLGGVVGQELVLVVVRGGGVLLAAVGGRGVVHVVLGGAVGQEGSGGAAEGSGPQGGGACRSGACCSPTRGRGRGAHGARGRR